MMFLEGRSFGDVVSDLETTSWRRCSNVLLVGSCRLLSAPMMYVFDRGGVGGVREGVCTYGQCVSV